ncbi:winged helix-turn-helix transcriptional regulator [Pedobacter gandavensis]|uniref:Transcriptional regulator n=1 Tax=Pedobacter gandavensis TaxID=2679963 RepID=A0ABR6ER90_9SPHI|nr:helix-turn-helix domain-containing protein [Pedobacter gandavensis]MBB2147481.1 transcriptional regulator [Pedobacter gandavensis]
MTTIKEDFEQEGCPAEGLLKLLSGKWKPQIFRLAVDGSVRFNSLLKKLPNSNKQSLSTALKELEEAKLLIRTIVKEKPLHIEYNLSKRGRALIPIFMDIEDLS